MGGALHLPTPPHRRLSRASEEPERPVRYYGLENFGNTCYCNSVLQSLYFCRPFRDAVLQHHASHLQGRLRRRKEDTTLLTCLAELFAEISAQRRPGGCVPPKQFVHCLRSENELFRSYSQQDAQEFLNYLLNRVVEVLEKKSASLGGSGAAGGGGGGTAGGKPGPPLASQHHAAHSRGAAGASTWVHDVFQGILVNETRCLQCESITRHEELFLDLSLDVEPNTSVTECIRQFSKTEHLAGREKFFCDQCLSLQEAQKRMRIKRLPRVLALHLKRFEYSEALQRHQKLGHRVAFPQRLKLCEPCTTRTTRSAGGGAPATGEGEGEGEGEAERAAACPAEEKSAEVAGGGGGGAAAKWAAPDAEADGVPMEREVEYNLLSVVIHIGSTPAQGHYISLVNVRGQWLCFDDEAVESVDGDVVDQFFGENNQAAYLLQVVVPTPSPPPNKKRRSCENSPKCRSCGSPARNSSDSTPLSSADPAHACELSQQHFRADNSRWAFLRGSWLMLMQLLVLRWELFSLLVGLLRRLHHVARCGVSFRRGRCIC